ncbi:MAG TPA: MMPL family transporter [Bacteroidia bacterium]
MYFILYIFYQTNMWSYLGRAILRNRITYLVVLLLITAFFGYEASKTQLSYSYARALPKDDPAYKDYTLFKELYGEDGSVMVVGFSDKDLFLLNKFNNWYDLTENIRKIPGIQDVLSITRIYRLIKNDSLSKFEVKPVIGRRPQSQDEVDSLHREILALPFYDGLVYNRETNATVMAITFNKDSLESHSRISIVENIEASVEKFGKENNIDMHLSGLPYIRTHIMKLVAGEMGLFMALAVLVTLIILYILFRSFYAVFFSIIVCLVGVTISLGTIVLLGYKITILTGLIPPLIMVIGVPNCIFIINKYQEEFIRHGNKIKALARTIEKVALSNFMANITTAIGFGVFYFTNSTLLVEFGLVAAINVMVTYAVAHILLPIIYSWLPPPSGKYTKHHQSKWITGTLNGINKLVHHYRIAIYAVIALLTIISFWGMTRIKLIGHVVDDLPQNDPVYTHLRFFESNFHGVLPFEVNVDTKKPNGVFSNNARTLYKINAFQRMMAKYPEFSRPVSAVEALKFAYQAYRDYQVNDQGKPIYTLPGSLELKKLSEYTSTVKGKENKLMAFIDTTKRFTRVSFQMADIGSDKMKVLVDEIEKRTDTIFNYDKETLKPVADSLKYNVMITGFSHVFLKSNDFLFHHLFVSLFIAIVLILIIGIMLFRSIAIIVLSKLPCLIPLAITAGVMGFLDIHFKPSTILVFSIAFGIASDGTIYILAEYRAQLRKKKFDRTQTAISRTINEVGRSMIYTNIILFFGFAIFAASSFGGTQALGILVSLTLLVSLITNLVLLPSILLSLEKLKQTKVLMQDSLISIIDEDEDIDLDKLVIHKPGDPELNTDEE